MRDGIGDLTAVLEEAQRNVAARIKREADAEGIGVDAYEAKLAAEAERRKADEREREQRAHRARQLEAVEPYLTARSLDAIVWRRPAKRTRALEAVNTWLSSGRDASPLLILTGGTGAVRRSPPRARWPGASGRRSTSTRATWRCAMSRSAATGSAASRRSTCAPR